MKKAKKKYTAQQDASRVNLQVPENRKWIFMSRDIEVPEEYRVTKEEQFVEILTNAYREGFHFSVSIAPDGHVMLGYRNKYDQENSLKGIGSIHGGLTVMLKHIHPFDAFQIELLFNAFSTAMEIFQGVPKEEQTKFRSK